MSILDKPAAGERRLTHTARQETAQALFHQAHEKNVGATERILTGLAGTAFLKFALHRHSLKGKLLFGTLAGSLLHRATTGYCPAYKAFGISSAQHHPALAEDYFDHGIHVETSCLLHATAEKLYAFWHDVANLPTIMTHLKSVERLTDTRSRWTAAGPFGRTVSWDAETIHDVPNELIAWKSVGNSDIENAGSIHFTPRQNGRTEVAVSLDYIPPAGRLGKFVAHLFGEDPDKTIHDDLNRFAGVLKMCDGHPA